MTETEQHTNQRLFFAESSFARTYGVQGVTKEMKHFCSEWALGKDEAPLTLANVDTYFKDLWTHIC